MKYKIYYDLGELFAELNKFLIAETGFYCKQPPDWDLISKDKVKELITEILACKDDLMMLQDIVLDGSLLELLERHAEDADWEESKIFLRGIEALIHIYMAKARLQSFGYLNLFKQV